MMAKQQAATMMYFFFMLSAYFSFFCKGSAFWLYKVMGYVVFSFFLCLLVFVLLFPSLSTDGKNYCFPFVLSCFLIFVAI